MEAADATTTCVLDDDDLLGLILLAQADGMLPWCCPPIGGRLPSVSRQRTRVILSRALRLRRVMHSWRRAVDWHIRAARSFDLRWCNPQLLRGLVAAKMNLHFASFDQATELLLDNLGESAVVPSFEMCTSLTALSMRQSALSDAALASAIASLPNGGRLRALSLGGSRSCGSMTIECLTAKQPRALTALDLSSCHCALTASPRRFESLLYACPRLANLDLSNTRGLGGPILGSVCLVLAATLTHLCLDGCDLDDARLGVEVDDDEPSNATPSSVEVESATPRRLWPRLTRLRELGLGDNPRVSARACVVILTAVPSLHSIQIGGADFWPSERDSLLSALSASPSLKWVGARFCGPWLDDHAVRVLTRAGVQLDADADVWRAAAAVVDATDGSVGGGQRAAPRCTPQVEPMESWEEVEDSLPAALSLAELLPSAAAAGSALTPRAPPRPPIDYDRPEHHRVEIRSIYHVSHGDRPLYAGGSVVRAQTGANGLRS